MVYMLDPNPNIYARDQMPSLTQSSICDTNKKPRKEKRIKIVKEGKTDYTMC